MKIRWLYVFLAALTVLMTVEPAFMPATAAETCCKEAQNEPSDCGNECQDENCEDQPAQETCPNKNNPFQICGCCNTFISFPASYIIAHLAPEENGSIKNIAFYQDKRPSAALNECWKPPRA